MDDIDEKTHVFVLTSQVQKNHHSNPKRRKKIARLAHLTHILRRKGGVIFSISECPGSGL